MNPLDPLEKLAQIEVPPVPEGQTLRAAVHRKLNPRLLVMHVVQFAVGATAWALVHMTAALAAFLRYTVTGRWPQGEGGGRKRPGSEPGKFL